MFKLVKAHFHKDKAVLAAFLIILVVAVTLLHTGLMVAQFDSMYDAKTEERNVADAMYFVLGDGDEILDHVNGMDEVDSSHLADIIFPDLVTLTVNDRKEKDVEDIFFVDKQHEAVYQDLNYVEKDESITGPSVSVNVYTAYSQGLRVGDKVKMSHPDLGTYEFTVAGIYEDLFCGQQYSYYSAIIDHESYEAMSEKAGSAVSGNQLPFSMQFLCVKFKEDSDVGISTTSVQDELNKAGIYCNGYNKSLAKAGYIRVLGKGRGTKYTAD